MKIAVTGKGGVGKTFIAGTLAGQYAAAGNKTIAIDADTSPNLALTLGMTEADLEKIIPLQKIHPSSRKRPKLITPEFLN